MTLLEFKENRLNDRLKVTGLMPGALFTESGEHSINCIVRDISRLGMGILTDERIPIGTRLVLVVRDKKIFFVVLWVKEDFFKRNLLRYGLASESRDVDLEALFRMTGCIKCHENGNASSRGNVVHLIKGDQFYGTHSRVKKRNWRKDYWRNDF